MKVNIGKFVNYVGAYQIADHLKYIGVSDDNCYKIGTWLSNTWIQNVCEWIHSKQTRKVKVKIHAYDTWNLDGTLAYIILPGLKLLKTDKHGSAMTDDEDVPEYLKSINAPPKENEWDVDDLCHLRWAWVLDEMIWTFEQLHPDNDWEAQYFTHPEKKELIDEKDDEDFMANISKIKYDKEGHTKHNNRIDNGLRLFGKYYRGLWT
jgi:hypothetical protein